MVPSNLSRDFIANKNQFDALRVKMQKNLREILLFCTEGQSGKIREVLDNNNDTAALLDELKLTV